MASSCRLALHKNEHVRADDDLPRLGEAWINTREEKGGNSNVLFIIWLSRNLCAVTQLPLILRIDDMRRPRGRLASAYLFLSLLGNYCTKIVNLLGTKKRIFEIDLIIGGTWGAFFNLYSTLSCKNFSADREYARFRSPTIRQVLKVKFFTCFGKSPSQTTFRLLGAQYITYSRSKTLFLEGKCTVMRSIPTTYDS